MQCHGRWRISHCGKWKPCEQHQNCCTSLIPWDRLVHRKHLMHGWKRWAAGSKQHSSVSTNTAKATAHCPLFHMLQDICTQCWVRNKDADSWMTNDSLKCSQCFKIKDLRKDSHYWRLSNTQCHLHSRHADISLEWHVLCFSSTILCLITIIHTHWRLLITLTCLDFHINNKTSCKLHGKQSWLSSTLGTQRTSQR